MTASVTIVTEECTGLAVPAEALHFAPEGQTSDNQTVWIKKGQDMMPQHVKVGMNDAAYYIIEQGLHEGDSVVLSAQFVAKETKKKTGENPFMPGPPGKNKNKK